MGTQGTSSNAGRARRERELGWEYTNRGSSYCIAIKSIFCLFVCLFKPTVLQISMLDPSLGPVWLCPPALPRLSRCSWSRLPSSKAEMPLERQRDTGMAQNVPFLWAWPRKGWAPPISWGQLCTAPNPPAPRGLPKSLLRYKSYGFILV